MPSVSRQHRLNDIRANRRLLRLCHDPGFRFANFNHRTTWWRRDGLLLLRRYTGPRSPRPACAPTIGWDNRPVSTVSSHSGVTCSGTRVYWHWAEKIGRGGVPAATPGRLTKAVVYSGGAYAGALPNAPSNVRVRQILGLKLLLTWVYNKLDEQIAPTSFDIFSDGGTGTMDWVTPIGNVAYDPGRWRYSWTSAVYPAAIKVALAVRGKSTNSVLSLIPKAKGGPHHEYDTMPIDKTSLQVVMQQTIDDPSTPVFV